MRFSFGSSAWWVAMICVLGLDAGLRTVSACTTIAVGKNASADGSTMCTHNADVRLIQLELDGESMAGYKSRWQGTNM